MQSYFFTTRCNNGRGSALVSLKTILLQLAKGGAIAMVENVNFKQAEVMPRLV